ncbi:MAG: glycosyltransferase [Gemmatimonas sp.]
MTRILHVIHGLTGGGAERQLTLLAEAQARRGHEVHVAVVRADNAESLHRAGVHVHVVEAAGHHDPMLLFRYEALMLRLAPDVVQTWLTQSDVFAGTAAILARKPWVLSERSSAEGYASGWKNKLRRWLGRMASAIVANSNGGAAYWRAMGVREDRLSTVRNIVPPLTDHGRRLLPLPDGSEGKRLILSVGRYSDEKNPLLMIDALNQVLNNPAGTGLPDAVALLCGAGPLESEMRARIAALNAGHCIKIVGYRNDVAALMQRASVCVSVSRYEGSPNIVLEAMAAGCPLIVADLPSYREIVDESSVEFVRPNDPFDIARGIVEVLQRPERARTRAVIAQSHVARYNDAQIVDQLDHVYAKARKK